MTTEETLFHYVNQIGERKFPSLQIVSAHNNTGFRVTHTDGYCFDIAKTENDFLFIGNYSGYKEIDVTGALELFKIWLRDVE